eukprot:CCRYP_001346-RB/>CCRYP_001346-RB protein AED:0.02 eAED:0.02 QI:79/1/1/1/1/1/3/359/697
MQYNNTEQCQKSHALIAEAFINHSLGRGASTCHLQLNLTMKHLAIVSIFFTTAAGLPAQKIEPRSHISHVDRYLKKTPAPTTDAPTRTPSLSPTISFAPTSRATISMAPTSNSTEAPTTMSPTASNAPSLLPSLAPSLSQQPSISPTATPSVYPSIAPSAIPSVSPTQSSQPSEAPWAYTRPPRVDIRYKPWLELDEDTKQVAMNLEYDRYSWENYGRNDVEFYSWEDLDDGYMGNATLLGYDQRSWDCWQNHYESYRWIDLALPGIQVLQFFDTLGYNISYWNGYTNSTTSRSEDRMWYDLSADERYAACQLCFIRRSWNEEDVVFNGMFPMVKPAFRFVEWDSLEDDKKEAAEELGYENVTWNVLGLAVVEERGWKKLTRQERAAATTLGWTDITWDCWSNHFRSYAWEDLVFYGLDFLYSALGWNASSWEGQQDPPPSSEKYWDLLNDIERESANALCYFRDNWDGEDMTPNNGPFPFRIPAKRYVPWKELPNADRQRAYDSLFYDEDTWDIYGVAEIEKKTWRDLTPWEQSEATKLGFIPNSWDCFQNHYLQKEWYDINWDIRDAMNILGWDEKTWAEQAQPDSYSNKWEVLSEDEQKAAYKICYFNINWPGGTDASIEDVATFIENVQAIQSSPVSISNIATDDTPQSSDSSNTKAGPSELAASMASPSSSGGWTPLITEFSTLFILAQLVI